MTESENRSAELPTVELGDKRMPLADAERLVRSSGSWFFWVAGLSLVNTIAAMLESGYGMVLGLGITQVADAIFLLDEAGSARSLGGGERLVHLAVVGSAIGLFAIFGVFARRLQGWAFLVGMLVYAADSLIYVLASDWIGVGFHAFVLFMLWNGYAILRAIRKASPALSGQITP